MAVAVPCVIQHAIREAATAVTQDHRGRVWEGLLPTLHWLRKPGGHLGIALGYCSTQVIKTYFSQLQYYAYQHRYVQTGFHVTKPVLLVVWRRG